MNNKEGYGVVYTPPKLAQFVSEILLFEYMRAHRNGDPKDITVVDPACGDGALLRAVSDAMKKNYPSTNHSLIGVDVDEMATRSIKKSYKIHIMNFDSILPMDSKKPEMYWREKVPKVSLIIANPPWSSEKIYKKDDLTSNGYLFNNGQYDSFVIFIELCLKIITEDGFCAFIIPDSIFAGENAALRRYLAENTTIRVIARLGEKIFANVNRATSVIIVQNKEPLVESLTKCFRLDTMQRNGFLQGSSDLLSIYQNSFHEVLQRRFLKNKNYSFNIDTRNEEENVIRKIETDRIDWNTIFKFGRGVEISKSGKVVKCPECRLYQGFSKRQENEHHKNCSNCKSSITIDASAISEIITENPDAQFRKIFVGESIHRYKKSSNKYIKMGVLGINYKDPQLYVPPKILIRKTGLGINATLDNSSSYISQTVYSCNYHNSKVEIPLEYYLGVLNSRIIFYYYIKMFGENEWKSHPYLTKEIVFSLPIKQVNSSNYKLCVEIAEATKGLLKHYSKQEDINIEQLVASLYEINTEEIESIRWEIDRLPDLGAINNMKF